jgi:hypothetical protein
VKHRRSNNTDTTKALAITSDKSKIRELKNMLYKMTNEHPKEKSKWPTTGDWLFVPFWEDGVVTTKHIMEMVQDHNTFLRKAINISVSGLRNINTPIKIPNSFATTPFILWLLSAKTEDDTPLFHSIERDTNGTYHFCTMKHLREAALTWIDDLGHSMEQLFS